MPHEDKKTYRYYLRNRPPSIGTHPAGAVNTVATEYQRMSDEFQSEKSDFWAHGYVEYGHPLTLPEIYGYQLFPTDSLEQAEYCFFMNAKRDPEVAERKKAKYMAYSDDDLRRYQKHDMPIADLCAAALVLKEQAKCPTV